jgi:predicted nucleic acid-binding protein
VEFYLQNPNNTIYVPQAVRRELGVSPTQTQWDRLSGFTVRARIIEVPDPSISQYNPTDLVSDPFDLNDMFILETARVMDLTLLTVNPRLKNQVNSYNPPSITTLGGYGPGRCGRLVARRWAWAAA